jgi:serine/threonine-protein kinase
MKVGPYEIQNELGAGGMGRVRLARAPDGRRVVLKNCLRDDPDDDQRLRDEARVGLRLRHPGVVETVELLEVADEHGKQRPVLVTAFVDGVSLLELRRTLPLSPALVCRLGRQLAAALDAIHGIVDEEGRPLGVLHRDVTAANCMLGDDGDARLIDFGIARSRESRALRTQTGLVRGTLRYLAPELFAGSGYSVQSDLWSLGVVLFEALVGRPAVTGNDVAAMGRICVGNLMELHPGETPDPRVLRALSQLLQKKPADRPRTARDAAAIFAMHEKALEKEHARRSVDDAQAAVSVVRARWNIATAMHASPRDVDETSGLAIDVDVDEPPFSHLPETVAVPDVEASTPRVQVLPAGRTAADALRDYAQSLASIEKQLLRVAEANAHADAAARARSAVLQDTSLWALPPGLDADVALMVGAPEVFATPPETIILPPGPAPVARTTTPPPLPASSPQAAPPLAFDVVATADTPARPRAGTPGIDAATGAPIAMVVGEADDAAVDGPIHDLLGAFLADDDTPTPTLSPLQQRQRLAALIPHDVHAPARTTTPSTVVRRAALALLLIAVGVGTALLVATMLR